LRDCFCSILQRPDPPPVVYVDSGSTDGSVNLAREMGAMVVELDMSIPFSAARARNSGFEHLLGRFPNLSFVQFVDGDCQIIDGWLARAAGELSSRPQVAVVCGRRRERHREATIYNRLCDIEWHTPVGESRSCGGDSMIRVEAFRQVSGYNPAVIAGEEPEMCLRLRQAGWKILRIDADMTLHDAAMARFGQWWKRNLRAGHAYAQAYAMHGRPPERFRAREVRSNWFWGLLLPLVSVALAWPTRGWSLLLLLGYPLLFARMYWRGKRSMPARDAAPWAAFVLLGKFANAAGQLKFTLNRLRGRQSTVIEYKQPACSH
jgi:glycosyltransferase involved in cell wall biosynthesis